MADGEAWVRVPTTGDWLVLNGKLVKVTTQYLSDTEALCTRVDPQEQEGTPSPAIPNGQGE